MNVLTELHKIDVHPKLFSTLKEEDKSPALNGSKGIFFYKNKFTLKGLIVRLFPILLEFVACNDNHAMQDILLSMFRIVSKELGLKSFKYE